MKRALLIVALLLGCGGGEGPKMTAGASGGTWTGGGGTGGTVPPEPDPLDGTRWISPIAGFTCDVGAAFANGSYTWLLACTLQSGSVGVMIETGDYSTNENTLTMIATQASCPAIINGDGSFTFSVSSAMLSVGGTAGLRTFEPFPGGTVVPGGATYGCFDDQGYFTPSPLRPI